MLFLATLILLVTTSAFFSASEIALISIPKSVVQYRANEGKLIYRLTLMLIKQPAFLSTILIGNNIANVFFSIVITIYSQVVFPTVPIFITGLLSTMCIIIAGEMLPKSYALKHPYKILYIITPILIVIHSILYPIYFIYFTIKKILLFGQNKKTETPIEDTSALESIKGSLDMLNNDNAEQRLFTNIILLSEQHISKFLIHRKDMHPISDKMSNSEILQYIQTIQDEYIYLYKNTKENICGTISIKDFLLYYSRDPNFSITKIIEKPTYIQENISNIDILRWLNLSKHKIVFIVDEYGSLKGNININKIMNILLENHHQSPIKKVSSNTYIALGSETITNINRILKTTISEEHAHTLAGLIMYYTKQIPEILETFTYNNIDFQVLEKRGQQIYKVKIHINEANKI